MGYRNDQFYQLPQMGGEQSGWTFSTNGRRNWANTGADNPTFVYPDREIRTWTSQKDRYGNNIPKVTLLKRGFMRNIPRLEEEPQFKCQFQFNPQTLTQEVQYSETVYNHYLRDPGSFAQPFAGNASMAFTLLFDRSMEINNPVTGYYDPLVSNFNSGSEVPDMRNPWETGAPQHVGVLRDIAAMYAVIGQGVNESELQNQLEAVKETIKSEALAQGAEDFDEVEYNKALSNADASFAQQVGNYAFLAPKPIRMVFSSLYIVEGYVTASSVTFSKFNSAYVPIQAQVHLTMSVQHLGFAKKDTYTTYAIERAREFVATAEETSRENARAAYQKAQESLTTWEMSLQGDYDPSATGTNYLVPNHLHPVNAARPSQYKVRLNGESNQFDAVRDLYDSGNTSIIFRGEFYLYTDIPGVPGAPRPSPKAWYYFNKPAATTKSAFNNLFDAGSIVGPGIIDGAYIPAQLFSPVNPNGGNWSVTWRLTIEVTHNGSRMLGTGSITRSFVGNATNWNVTPLKQDVTLSWSWSGDPVSTDPLTPSIGGPRSGEPSTVR